MASGLGDEIEDTDRDSENSVSRLERQNAPLFGWWRWVFNLCRLSRTESVSVVATRPGNCSGSSSFGHALFQHLWIHKWCWRLCSYQRTPHIWKFAGNWFYFSYYRYMCLDTVKIIIVLRDIHTIYNIQDGWLEAFCPGWKWQLRMCTGSRWEGESLTETSGAGEGFLVESVGFLQDAAERDGGNRHISKT